MQLSVGDLVEMRDGEAYWLMEVVALQPKDLWISQDFQPHVQMQHIINTFMPNTTGCVVNVRVGRLVECDARVIKET
jgi:hypothetical protein